MPDSGMMDIAWGGGAADLPVVPDSQEVRGVDAVGMEIRPRIGGASPKSGVKYAVDGRAADLLAVMDGAGAGFGGARRVEINE